MPFVEPAETSLMDLGMGSGTGPNRHSVTVFDFRGLDPAPRAVSPSGSLSRTLNQIGTGHHPDSLPHSAPGVSTRGRTSGRWNPEKGPFGATRSIELICKTRSILADPSFLTGRPHLSRQALPLLQNRSNHHRPEWSDRFPLGVQDGW
jgi:hypothetical protein